MSSLDPAIPGRSHRVFRGAAMTFAFVLACQAMWILTAEFYRPELPVFPADAKAADVATTQRSAATAAASVGVVRGDLWAECALTYLGLLWNDNQDRVSPQTPETMQRAREVADRALRFSPHDARIWLILAGLDSRFDWLNGKAAAALRMSYYTGANETELIGLRLPLAVRSDALSNKDFQQLVGHDIRVIVTRKPGLKPVILAAYRDALPTGQQFIEQTLTEIDPTQLERLRPQQ
jgi:hypothetical protein